MRPHKLHATILSNAMHSHPAHSNEGSVTAPRQEDSLKALSVPLDRYVGDVLCIYYLIGHSVANMIEGGPDEEAWIDSIVDHMECTDEDLTSCDMDTITPTNVGVSAWYRAWVFLHCTLLRVAPFTPEQQRSLGILQNSGQEETAAKAGPLAYQFPPKPFRGCNKSMLMRGISRITNFEPLHVTYNDFGRLGPTYRGRDLMQTQTLFPVSAVGVAIAFESMSPYAYYGSDFNLGRFLHSWVRGEDSVIQWLLALHSESGRSKPMTVAPPSVTIRCSLGD
eukprot:CAMPEP_0116833160 /NCGR_PEP_ID=MMETSP0418-20121206/6284_1 /TAXON_ID=1158023 /ORGANISM="Astrosyne radiata, Strain 13vi08-1A" /LENGTH=278 /DNA_ID=CAMNT_0004462583 /DNA_START=254 /DNA_END=1090 /DNA_ORIENTATION=-